jgi:hypothetical protein
LGPAARWQEEDCRHAVDDLAACEEHDVAAGLELGGQWLPISLMQRIAAPVLLLAPDAQASTNSTTQRRSAAPNAAMHKQRSAPKL